VCHLPNFPGPGTTSHPTFLPGFHVADSGYLPTRQHVNKPAGSLAHWLLVFIWEFVESRLYLITSRPDQSWNGHGQADAHNYHGPTTRAFWSVWRLDVMNQLVVIRTLHLGGIPQTIAPHTHVNPIALAVDHYDPNISSSLYHGTSPHHHQPNLSDSGHCQRTLYRSSKRRCTSRLWFLIQMLVGCTSAVQLISHREVAPGSCAVPGLLRAHLNPRS
jgi:hypothetical protein